MGDKVDENNRRIKELKRLLAEAEATRTRAAEPASPNLPADLLEALRVEKDQYRAVPIRSVSELRRDEKLIVLQPIPSADADWMGGRFLAYGEDSLKWAGEIIHVDAETGDAYLLPEDPPTDEQLDAATRWYYQPFDFSDAIMTAAKRASVDDRRVANALEWVLDGAAGRVTKGPAPSIAALWELPWALLWGPPGTGKTQSVAEKIADSVVTDPKRRIVAVAPTNRAVDELTVRVCRVLSKRNQLSDAGGGCRVFRGGTGAGRDVVDAFPEALHDLAYRQLAKRRDELQREITRREARGAPDREIAQLRSELREISRLTDETLVAAQRGNASVITLTVHRALRLAGELEGNSTFFKVLLDEGGMISRASSAMLSLLGDSMLVAGDPKQIGPVCRATEGSPSVVQKWLRSSPLSHLRDARSDIAFSNVALLRTQHRMHPEISRVVSEFQYSRQLLDGDGPRKLAAGASIRGFPSARAVWVVLDDSTKDQRRICHDRAQTGRGYVRRLSAEILVQLAEAALTHGASVLAATPYRAQAQLLRELAAENELSLDGFTASTIHKQQGAEYDVVFIDTVAAGRPFQATDLCAMLNVAASRARRHLFVLASRAEAEAAIPARFLSLFQTMRADGGRLEPVSFELRREPEMPRVAESLGSEIYNLMSSEPLYTDEQVKLFERQFGEGHYLVRGVAGSGKTFVLANWVARLLKDEPNAHILISYFNKALAPLVEKLVRRALVERVGARDATELAARVTIINVDQLTAKGFNGGFDAVFVDEAQDMPPEVLSYLYNRAREVTDRDGQVRRRFFIFMDDSQNIYGHKPIEDFRKELATSINFTGRTRVLREAFRSTREILDLAFNVVLDPQEIHGVPSPGMKEFMKENELVQANLLRRPGEGRDGLYHVDYTERGGVLPIVVGCSDRANEGQRLVSIVKSLHETESVRLADILVVSPMKPTHWANVLKQAGIHATAYGGSKGEDASNFPIGRVDHIRTTTIFSCKGHESPVVILCGLDALDNATEWMKGMATKEPREVEKQLRSTFYVGATRAKVRQYILGLESARFLRTSREYVRLLSGAPFT